MRKTSRDPRASRSSIPHRRSLAPVRSGLRALRRDKDRPDCDRFTGHGFGEAKTVLEIGAFAANTPCRNCSGARMPANASSSPSAAGSVAEPILLRAQDPGKVRFAIDAQKDFQQGNGLDGLPVREIVKEARKCR